MPRIFTEFLVGCIQTQCLTQDTSAHLHA